MSEDRERRELEGRVRELEATVQGLTTELMDATERIRELEAAIEDDTADEGAAGGSTTDESSRTSWVPATDELADEDGTSTDETTTPETDDIIVA